MPVRLVILILAAFTTILFLATCNTGPRPLFKKIDPEKLSAKDVFDGYENGDELSKKVISNAIECWGMAVANLVSSFNPEKISPTHHMNMN